MNKISLTFTANQQTLKNTTKNVRLASGTVDYVEATFELGDNWSGFDSVRAVWSKKADVYSTVLDAYGHCIVPNELFEDKGTIKVNLVGSIAEEVEEETVLTDRLTTFQETALSVSAIVPLEGDETSPLTPSQFEQYVLIVHGYADDAVDAKEAAETAQGLAETAAQQANTYQGWAQNYADNARGYANDANNSKWAAATSETNAANSATSAANSATTAQGHATNAQTSATNASESAIEAGEHSYEAQNYARSARSYAVGGTGSRAGEDTDNAMYYNSQASASAQAAEDAKDEAEAIAGSMVTNLKDGSATGSVRGINATGESSSYTMGQNAFAEGSGTKASGLSSHAEGGGTTASGPYAHAEGGGTNASGQYAHAEGNGTTASTDYAHAEGLSTTASGYDAHAEGYMTTASQGAAHAEGANTTASGVNSHAEGEGTVASGLGSHAEGYYTTASSGIQHVEGRYNIPDADDKYAHIIGNGTYRTRSNAYTVDWDGNVEAAGSFTDGSGNILSDKVDKVTGKGLSTEDYTTAEKTKLGTIEEGAQVNIPVDVELSDTSTNPVQNKAIKEVIDKLAITDEASGSLVTIPDGANLPMKSLKVTLTPQQDDTPWIGTTHDTTPYLHRAMPTQSNDYNRESGSLVGGTVAWNQLCPELNASNWSGSNTTRTYSDGVATIVPSALYGIISKSGVHSGVKVIIPSHKYLMMADVKAVSDTTLAFVIGDNTNFTYAKDFTATTSWAKYSSVINITSSSVANAVYYGIRSNYSVNLAEYQLKNFMMFDLTAMFGPTIADYIYSLEQANAGAGVAWFRRYFPEDYYPYSANTLQSVQATAHKTYDSDGNVLGNYALDSSLTLRGMPKLDASNNLYYDGDTYASDGGVTRKYGVCVDLGALNWVYDSTNERFYTYGVEDAKNYFNAVCSKYPFVGGYYDLVDKSVAYIYYNKVCIKDSSYTDAATFKAAMSGVMLVYELATPTTETADPYTNPQIVDPDGTEEYVTENYVPVGHDSTYALVCPISGYDEVSAVVSPTTTASDGQTYTADLPQTVYGGTVDLVSGEIKAYPYYASYNGETLTGEWISDRDPYVAGTTPSIGAQVVNIGAAPVSLNITPQEIRTLLGTNNVWSNGSNNYIKYIADTKLYILKVTQ